jgi:MOSC domain-containing protein YiiM
MNPLRIEHLYVSAGHNFFGRTGHPPGTHAIEERDEIRCVAGCGIEGDRFFDYKTDYKGQITFFSGEVFDDLCAQLNLTEKSPASLRRNVITRGVSLIDWYAGEFEIQGVRFLGMGECKPCYWMDQAIGPGAEAALKGRGGLRAKILSSGSLAVNAVERTRACVRA